MSTRPIFFIAAALWLSSGLHAQQSTPVVFLGVASDPSYTEADRKLARQLSDKVGRQIEYGSQPETYSDLIGEVINRKNAFIARMTPYAYVSARMLGARVDAIATYVRRDPRATTYNVYFVVNAARFGNLARTPEGVSEYITKGGEQGPSHFVYRQQFSTSGYFLPALWLRSRHIFVADQDSKGIVRITSSQLGTDRSDVKSVIDAVATGVADFGAVWDADKTAYEQRLDRSAGPPVLFIKLPESVPNDMLVASSAIGPDDRKRLSEALKNMSPIDIGDFHTWTPMPDAHDALGALASLERAAAAPPAPVVVRIMSVGEGAEFVEQARQALRLAGTEFVLYDENFHNQYDVTWTLEKVHNGALALESEMAEPLLQGLSQRFQISYTDTEGDVATRIVSLIHSRMHRLRYLWPYEARSATVLRDVDVVIPPNITLKAQRVVWRDPDRNEYSRGQVEDATVVASDPYKLTLKGNFPSNFANPLSNVAYRVILERRSNESVAARALTLTFLGLLALAAVGAGVDMRRRLTPPKEIPRTLRDVCAALAWRRHAVWHGHTLRDAELIWSERPRIEELIAELKGAGVVPASMGGITRWMYSLKGGISIPGWRGLSGGAEVGRQVELVVDPTSVGDTARLGALIDLLVRRRLLSLFVGQPLEWDALNDLARGILTPVGGAVKKERLVRAEDETVIEIASRHFNQVLDDAMKQLSLFPGKWTVTHGDDTQLLRQQVLLAGPLLIGDDRDQVTSLLLEFDLPNDLFLPIERGTTGIECWLLGKIVRLTYSDDSRAELRVHFRTLAVLLAETLTSRLDPAPTSATVVSASENDAFE